MVTNTTDVSDYDTAQVSQVPLTNIVKALPSMVNSVDVEPSTVISTQPQTKYILWNMLVLQLHLKQ